MDNRLNRMTEGPIFKGVVLYTLPIILTSVLQMLLNTADLIIVGQFCGSRSVGAVGATGALTSLIVNFFIGFSVGSGVCTAHSVGAGNDTGTKRCVSSSMCVALVCGVIVTAIGVVASEGLLRLMDTPAEIVKLSATYMKIYFSGAVATLLYNFGASILRAVGETKKPLYFLIMTGVLNVVLNVIFVTVFDMDVAGVALATVLAQVLSATLVVIELLRRKDACRLVIKELGFYRNETIKILKMGVPTGIQSSLFSISNVLIQSGINSFGIAAVSGNSAASSIENFTYVAMNAFQQTAMNFTGQNMGAGKIKRVRKIFYACMILVVSVGVAIGLVCFIFGRNLLSIYVGNDAEAIAAGIQKIIWVGLPYFLCGIMDVSTGTLRGMGYSMAPLLTTVGGVCVFRVLWMATVFKIPAMHSLGGLFVSYPISWLFTGVVNAFLFFKYIKRVEDRMLK